MLNHVEKQQIYL